MGTRDHRTPVLIIGGGLTGLATAFFLARQGVRATLVERHPTESIMPKARAFNPRTVEILRGHGLADEVRARRSYLADFPEMIGADTLAGQERFRVDFADHYRAPVELSPVAWAAIDQDELERLLRARAIAAGADIRFDTEMISLDSRTDGVEVVVRESAGTEYRIGADYLVAADGHRAGIRAGLGIGTDQALPPALGAYIIFAADLTEAMRGRRFILAYLDKPTPNTTLVPVGPNRWTISFGYAPGERPSDYTEERCTELTRQAIGLSDVDITLLPPVPGRPEKVAHTSATGGGVIAHRFRDGRVFLIGDAAHTVPPSGAYGASTGIADAHNLAWKLTAVLAGHGAPALLDTYDAERRPVALATLAHTLDVMRARGTGTVEDNAALDDLTMIFGYRYTSAAVHTEHPGGITSDPRTATGEPGLRAPHVWLARNGTRFSTTELCAGVWTLLTGPEDDWDAEVKSAPVAIDAYRVGTDLADPDGTFLASFGLTGTGATLIRPDGFVAWRSAARPAEPVLHQAMRGLLGH
ncbi:FAD-dependent oxidoreductase [Actinokineospora enzanensis]|uniref:FAD-dependent oxidoreductase n=1 Tax=Actinokineospora enzanensis TaxID=155975 RepID=UPI00036C2F50|nr:FAD-dependent oxidoreductase [Actinokineospora enzanensis]